MTDVRPEPLPSFQEPVTPTVTPTATPFADPGTNRVEWSAPAPMAAEAPEDESSADEEPDPYEYVRTPDGTIRAVPRTAIKETVTQDAPAPSTADVPETQFYVWLADGSVVRVKESDLPVPGGTNATFGHWQRGSDVYTVVGVYPVEDTVKGVKS